MLFLLSLFAFTASTSALLNIPKNIDFTTNFYNTSNCSIANKTVVMKNMCYDTGSATNGYPTCCNDLLKDVSLFPNTSFNTCLPFQIPNTPFTSVGYDCGLTKINGLNRTETLAYIGLISIALFIIAVLIFGVSCFIRCCRGRNSYSNI
jgi:hypothetical protein